MFHKTLLALIVLAGGCATAPIAETSGACVPAASWVSPRTGDVIPPSAVIARASRADVVLLGEGHTNAEDHEWQTHVLATLHARRDLAIGVEMLPRRVQPALDRWLSGDIDRKTFLNESQWNTVWGYDFALYAPIFRFARLHRVPMYALNVDRSVVSSAGMGGWAILSDAQRGDLTRPAPPLPEYRDYLGEVWAAHAPADEEDEPVDVDLTSRGFINFVEAQTVWDRAMAQILARAKHEHPDRLIVGIMGSGHVAYGWGVAHQLADLGISDTALLLPWDVAQPCADLEPGIADAVFGMRYEPVDDSDRPRLGVMIKMDAGRVVVEDVVDDSVAAVAGIEAGDVILEAAGVELEEMEDLIEIVQRQAPGTWLPLTIRRKGVNSEFIAKFPPETD